MNRTLGHLTKNYQEAVSSLVWIKIVGIGNTATGKTCLIKHFCESKDEDNTNDELLEFSAGYQPTVGVDYGFKIQTVNSTDLRVHLWDLSGSTEYLDVRNELYCGSDAILIVYDVTSAESFDALEAWVREVNRYSTPAGSPDIFIVGNKVDLKQRRVVSAAEGKEFALQHKYRYFETSAATGEGIDDMFQQILLAVSERKVPKSTNSRG